MEFHAGLVVVFASAIRRHARRFAPERYRSQLREEIAALFA